MKIALYALLFTVLGLWACGWAKADLKDEPLYHIHILLVQDGPKAEMLRWEKELSSGERQTLRTVFSSAPSWTAARAALIRETGKMLKAKGYSR